MERKKLSKVAATAAAIGLCIGVVTNPIESHADSGSGGGGGGGWFWQGVEVKCTATIIYGGGPLPFARQDSWEGKKIVCRDGWTVCWSTLCN